METRTYTLQAKHLAAASYFIAKKDVRYFLEGIHITASKNGTIDVTATNGHVLLKVSHCGESNSEEPLLVKFNTEQLRILRKKANLEKEVVLTVEHDHSVESDFCKMTIDSMVLPANVIDATFPNANQVIPPEPNYLEKVDLLNSNVPSFDPAYLTLFDKVAKIYTERRPAIRLRYGEHESAAMRVEFPKTQENVVGVLMPMRI